MKVVIRPIGLFPGGSGIAESVLFSDAAKLRLAQHHSRIEGTLKFWKREAEKHRRFHSYCLWWSIIESVSIPILAQAISADPLSKRLLTLVSAHTALLLALHRCLKVESNFRAFRQAESEFYDLQRRLLDSPTSFGETEEEQLRLYFDRAERIRRAARDAETDNTPSIQSLPPSMSSD